MGQGLRVMREKAMADCLGVTWRLAETVTFS